jgi:predicted PurR-regulated permease PerM
VALQNAGQHGGEPLGAFARRVLVVAAIITLALLTWRIMNALLLAFIGVLFAVMFRGLARLVSRYTRVPMQWSLLFVVAFLIGIVVLLIWLAGPSINEQVAEFMETVPTSVRQVEETLGRLTWGQYLLESMKPGRLSVSPGIGLFSRITGVASTVFAVVANLLVVTFVAIFFAADPAPYIRGIILLVPKSESARVAQTIEATGHTLRYWLLGQGVSMLAVGILTALGLWLAGVPLAFLLGVIAGILEFVPFLGPVAAAIPGILIALTRGWKLALYAALVYVIVQQLENRLIVPLVQWKAVSLPPALVILAVVALGLLFGLLGVLVATPLTAVIVVWVKMLYVQEVLDKPVHMR